MTITILKFPSFSPYKHYLKSKVYVGRKAVFISTQKSHSWWMQKKTPILKIDKSLKYGSKGAKQNERQTKIPTKTRDSFLKLQDGITQLKSKGYKIIIHCRKATRKHP